MSVPIPTTEEFISIINRSDKPVLLVEGGEDLDALRTLEREMGLIGALLICGGRPQLFELVDVRERMTNKKVAFLADQDLYVVQGGHKTHPNLVKLGGIV